MKTLRTPMNAPNEAALVFPGWNTLSRARCGAAPANQQCEDPLLHPL